MGNTFYLDFVSGNDANDGSDWANAWKTITAGPTAARIAPGDIIRIAKSPDPTSLGQSATWTNGSNTVTLTSAVTANIATCDNAWTPSADVTSTADVTGIHKEGTACAKHVFGAGFTTGLASYKALGGATDFSGYQQVSFWVRCAGATVTGGMFSLRLCSDAAGVTTVDTIALPAIPIVGRWQVVTIDTAGALGSSIQSVALYADSDPGTRTLYLDNIIACKASGSADSLSLTSLLSKNALAQGGTEAWYPLKSINSTTVILGGHTELSRVNDHPKYNGTTESVTTYKREPINMTASAATSTTVNAVQDNGTVAAPIEFQGGYNVATSLQDGETFLCGRNSNGGGLDLNAKSFITINRLNFVRWYQGILIDTSCEGIRLTSVQTIAACNYGITGFGYNGVATLLQNILNCVTANLNLRINGVIETLGNASGDGGNGATTDGILFGATTNGFFIQNAGNVWYCNYGINTADGHTMRIHNISIGGSNTASIKHSDNSADSILDLYNADLQDAVEVVLTTTPIPRRVRSQRHDQTALNHFTFDAHGLINSQAAVRHTASGIAWELAPTSKDKREKFPLEIPILQVACAAGSLVTVKAWLRRDHSTDIEGRIIMKGGTMQGVATDVSDSLTAAADTWEELQIQFTPTEAEIAVIYAQAYYPDSVGTYTYTVYVDDVSVTQA